MHFWGLTPSPSKPKRSATNVGVSSWLKDPHEKFNSESSDHESDDDLSDNELSEAQHWQLQRLLDEESSPITCSTRQVDERCLNLLISAALTLAADEVVIVLVWIPFDMIYKTHNHNLQTKILRNRS